MTRRSRTRRSLTVAAFGAPMAVACFALIACADRAGDAAHPSALVGRWVRLRPDRSWGDTMEFRPDGRLLGSTGYPVPPTLQWEVKRSADGVLQYCAAQGENGFCRTYHLSGDTLEMLGGPQGNTTFRRVP